MFKDTRTYTDFNGVERTEDVYFHLSIPELIDMQFDSGEDSYADYIEKVLAAKDSKKLIEIFKSLLLKSYGQKSEDGRTFRKTSELTNDFECSQVYADLYMQLATDSDYAAKFINGIVPSDLDAQIAKFQNKMENA
jgi:hypothetical protein